MLQEHIEPVNLEDVERIGSAHHGQLAKPHAGGGDAVNAGVVEHSELVLHEPVEVLPPEPRAVDVKLLERTDEDVSRHPDAVLGVGR